MDNVDAHKPARTGIEAAKLVEDYLNLRGFYDVGDAANIIHLLNEAGCLRHSGRVAERPGELSWHCSDPDNGPDVGLSVCIGKDDSLWCGEISRSLFEEAGSPFDNDFGWFLVRYTGGSARLLAKLAGPAEAQEFMEQVAEWVRAALGE